MWMNFVKTLYCNSREGHQITKKEYPGSTTLPMMKNDLLTKPGRLVRLLGSQELMVVD
jgi:hypothetical protein